MNKSVDSGHVEKICRVMFHTDRRRERNCNIRTKKEALQELSGIKTNKQKVEHIKVQTKQKEVTECTYQSLHADLLLVFC